MTDSTLDWRQGVHDSMPVFAGYLSIGLAFGIVATAANFFSVAVFFTVDDSLLRGGAIYHRSDAGSWRGCDDDFTDHCFGQYAHVLTITIRDDRF